MLEENHIFTIKTKDAENVEAIKASGRNVVISGLNVLKDQIRKGDFVFVVFGGDKPAWQTGLTGVGHISKTPYDEGYDGKKNFRVEIDIDVYFEPPITRSDLVAYPETYDVIGIAPITKWEPNQAITSVPLKKAIALIQAICELRTEECGRIERVLGADFLLVLDSVGRFKYERSPFGSGRLVDLRGEFIAWAPYKKPTIRGTRANEDTIKKYVGYLQCLEAPMETEGKHCCSGWNGVLEFVCGHNPAKKYYQIDNVAEFDLNFGILKKIFNGEQPPDDVNVANYNKVVAWASTPYFKKHACFTSAYDAYREFLEWRQSNVANGTSLPVIKTVDPMDINNLLDFVSEFKSGVDFVGLNYTDKLVTRFACVQLAKSFVVLTGLSGSGKTKLAQAFTKWIGVENTYKVVPVGADWTNSEKLLGYPDALQPGKYVMPDTGVLKLMLDARDNPKLPFFLILDEMNLSHVERYFADFLSAMESGEDIKLHGGKENYEGSDGTKVPPTLKFPKNLFVIGTMNVDETTYMFSPKVLDRAQVIEFRVDKDEMAAFLDNPTTPNLDAIAGKGAKYAEAFLKLKDNPPPLDKENETTNKNAINAALKKFFEPLAELGAEFGYRTAGEVIRFCRYYLAAGATIDDAIDAAIVQKLLPKLHGSQQRLAPVLRKLKELASTTAMQQDGDGEAKKIQLPLYKLACEKLDRMLIRLKANGFTSFAEA